MTIDIDDAINALLAYQQADMEGTMVLTSRQAIHEVANEIRRIRADAQGSFGPSVAWQRRFKHSTNGTWTEWEFSRLSREEFQYKFGYLIENGECEVRDIYAAQPPAAPVEKLLEGCHPALGWPRPERPRSSAGTAKPTKTVYVKRWRTLVELPEKYADEIVQALRDEPQKVFKPADVEPRTAAGSLD